MRDHDSNAATILGAFILGGLLGAGIALLAAPRSGRETREQLSEWADTASERTRESLDRFAREAGDRVRETGDRLRDVASNARERIAARRGGVEQLDEEPETL